MKLFDPNKRFYKGNTHAHSTMSDGRLAPEAVMELYAAEDHDFLILTDHWKMSPEQRHGKMLVVPGMEIDFSFEREVLHVVCAMPDCELAKHVSRGSCDYQEAIDTVNKLGGAAIIAHPAWSLNTPDFLLGVKGACAAEVFNTFSGAPWNAPRADSSQILDVVSAQGKVYPLVACDDSHAYSGEAGQSYTMVQADDLSVASIIGALKRGSFYASQGPEFLDVEVKDDQIIATTSPVSRITFASNLQWVSNRTTTGDGLTTVSYDIQRARKERFVRCEIEDAQGKKAWLSPIEIKY